jgi:hypothetical protein
LPASAQGTVITGGYSKRYSVFSACYCKSVKAQVFRFSFPIVIRVIKLKRDKALYLHYFTGLKILLIHILIYRKTTSALSRVSFGKDSTIKKG